MNPGVAARAPWRLGRQGSLEGRDSPGPGVERAGRGDAAEPGPALRLGHGREGPQDEAAAQRSLPLILSAHKPFSERVVRAANEAEEVSEAAE